MVVSSVGNLVPKIGNYREPVLIPFHVPVWVCPFQNPFKHKETHRFRWVLPVHPQGFPPMTDLQLVTLNYFTLSIILESFTASL